MNLLLAFLLSLSVFDVGTISALKVSCKNEEKQDVDWYYLYKLPKHHSNEINSDQSGLRYSYVTSETFTTQGWQLSNILINETNSFPGRTLSMLFNDTGVLLIAYNDEVPDGPTDNENGHTKGVVATDGVNAIWLIHSVPKFPKISDYTFPSTGEHYGQSFLCVTLNATTQMNNVARQLLFNEPNVYFHRIPTGLSGRYPDLGKVIAKDWRSAAPFYNLEELKSANDIVFKSFAKGRNFKADLYKNFIAPELDVDLLVESWKNGPGRLPSNCSGKDKVYNVAMIDEPNFSFKSTMDHSKWAVAEDAEDDWICVGDINRAEHQLERGGGSLCQKNRKIANIYRGVIGRFDKCQAGKAKVL